MSWTGRRKKGQIWRFTLETGNPPRLCVKARPTIRHGRACTRDSKIVPPYVPQDVQSTLSSDRDDRRQVPSGAKITAPDCAEDQPPAAAYRCGCGRGRQRHVRGVHKNGSTGTLKPSSSQTVQITQERKARRKPRDWSPEPEPAKHGQCRETCPLSSHIFSWRRPFVGGASNRHYTAALIRWLEGGSTSLIRPSLDEMPSRSEPNRGRDDSLDPKPSPATSLLSSAHMPSSPLT